MFLLKNDIRVFYYTFFHGCLGNDIDKRRKLSLTVGYYHDIPRLILQFVCIMLPDIKYYLFKLTGVSNVFFWQNRNNLRVSVVYCGNYFISILPWRPYITPIIHTLEILTLYYYLYLYLLIILMYMELYIPTLHWCGCALKSITHITILL